MKEINFKIPFTKTDGCVIINAKDWQDNTTQLVQAYNLKGERSISYINKVLATNYSEEIYGNEVNEGDLVFITRQASKVGYLKPFKLPNDSNEYAHIHLLQLIGKFKDNKVKFDNLIPLYNKVVMKKLKATSQGLLDLGYNNTMVGKVLKVGTCYFNKKWEPVPLNIEVGKVVLVRDNVTTDITLDGEDYIAVEHNFIVGEFSGDNYTLENLTLYDDNILLERYEDEKVEGSMFYKPNKYDYEGACEMSEFFQDNYFKVIKVGKNVTKVKAGDVVIADSDYMNDVTVGSTTYDLLNGLRYIQAVIKEKDNDSRN